VDPGSLDRVRAVGMRHFCHIPPLHQSAKQGNFRPGSSFWKKMKSHKSMATTFTEQDRQPICLDMPPEHVGVMTALRRAFQAAAEEPSDRDFAELLKKLN
jgi:hypothetical protein